MVRKDGHQLQVAGDNATQIQARSVHLTQIHLSIQRGAPAAETPARQRCPGELSLDDLRGIAAETGNYAAVIDIATIRYQQASEPDALESAPEVLLLRSALYQQSGHLKAAVADLRDAVRIGGREIARRPSVAVLQGKILSQGSADPHRLTRWLARRTGADGHATAKLTDDHLASLYWRLGIIWLHSDVRLADRYLRAHAHSARARSYQIANNSQCFAVEMLAHVVKGGGIKTLAGARDLLASAYALYRDEHSFSFRDKCIVSNLILSGVADRLARRYASGARRIMYARWLMRRMGVHVRHEAVAEIVRVLRVLDPEAHAMLTVADAPGWIASHHDAPVLREAYMDASTDTLGASVDHNRLVAVYEHLDGAPE